MCRSLSEARAQGGRSSGCNTLMFEHPDCSFNSLMVTPPLPIRLPACVAQISILHSDRAFMIVSCLITLEGYGAQIPTMVADRTEIATLEQCWCVSQELIRFALDFL
jgi:hypothetical protein